MKLVYRCNSQNEFHKKGFKVKNFIKLITITTYLSTHNVMGSSFDSCGDTVSQKIINAETVAIEKIDEMVSILDDKYNPNIDGIQNSIEILMCAQNKIRNSFHFVCKNEPEKNYFMRTLPLIGKEILVNLNFKKLFNPLNLSSAIIHEATHKCGTNDAAYFRTSSPKSTRLFHWSSIADTYEYWAKNGVCIPDVDC